MSRGLKWFTAALCLVVAPLVLAGVWLVGSLVFDNRDFDTAALASEASRVPGIASAEVRQITVAGGLGQSVRFDLAAEPVESSDAAISTLDEVLTFIGRQSRMESAEVSLTQPVAAGTVELRFRAGDNSVTLHAIVAALVHEIEQGMVRARGDAAACTSGGISDPSEASELLGAPAQPGCASLNRAVEVAPGVSVRHAVKPGWSVSDLGLSLVLGSPWLDRFAEVSCGTDHTAPPRCTLRFKPGFAAEAEEDAVVGLIQSAVARNLTIMIGAIGFSDFAVTPKGVTANLDSQSGQVLRERTERVLSRTR